MTRFLNQGGKDSLLRCELLISLLSAARHIRASGAALFVSELSTESYADASTTMEKNAAVDALVFCIDSHNVPHYAIHTVRTRPPIDRCAAGKPPAANQQPGKKGHNMG